MGRLRSALASLWNICKKSASDMWRATCASNSGTLSANDSALGSLRSSMRLATKTEPTPPLPSECRTKNPPKVRRAGIHEGSRLPCGVAATLRLARGRSTTRSSVIAMSEAIGRG